MNDLTAEQRAALEVLHQAGQDLYGEMMWLDGGCYTPGAAKKTARAWNDAVKQTEDAFGVELE
jgi:hypothetical protein